MLRVLISVPDAGPQQTPLVSGRRAVSDLLPAAEACGRVKWNGSRLVSTRISSSSGWHMPLWTARGGLLPPCIWMPRRGRWRRPLARR